MKTKLSGYFFILPALAIALCGIDALAQRAQYASVVTNTPGLLGYWRFDPASGTNSIVNGYQGALKGNAQIGPAGSGAPVATDADNRGLHLDGQGSFMQTTLGGQIAGAGSTMAWVYLTNYPSVAGRIFQITSEGDTGNDFDFQINTDNLLHFYTDGGSSTVSPQPVTTNQWHMLAGTFIANSVRVVYVDGVAVATNTPGGHSADTSYYTIGENLQFPGRYFEGTIAEVAVFNQALSAAQISNIYAAAVYAPVLSIFPTGTTVVLSWPTNFPNYTLQTNGLPGLPAGWVDDLAAVFVVGTNFRVTEGAVGSTKFYRLSGSP